MGTTDPAPVAGGFEALVYSAWLDRLFPCRVIASSGDTVLIETNLGGETQRLQVPRRLVYQRPARDLARAEVGEDAQ